MLGSILLDACIQISENRHYCVVSNNTSINTLLISVMSSKNTYEGHD